MYGLQSSPLIYHPSRSIRIERQIYVYYMVTIPIAYPAILWLCFLLNLGQNGLLLRHLSKQLSFGYRALHIVNDENFHFFLYRRLSV